jgi:sugar lactone lactonase YvrE
MTNLNITYARTFAGLIIVLTLLSVVSANADEDAAPEIKKIAAFQDQGGEILLRSPLAIALDESNGDLIVTSFEAAEVVILDKSGSLIKRLGKQNGIISPYGVSIDEKGQIYVSEVQTGLLKVFSPGGLLVDKIDLSEVMGRTVSPGRITIDKEGFIYISDLMDNEILIFNDKGDFVRSVGKFESLQKAQNAGGKIIGVSSMGNAVKVFDKEGALLQSFGKHGDESRKNFSFPTGFAVDSKGRLWIADAFQHRLKVFSLEGKFLYNFGYMEEKKWMFFFPVDLCFGKKGELFVVEKGANRIQVFQVSDLKE